MIYSLCTSKLDSKTFHSLGKLILKLKSLKVYLLLLI